MDIVQLFECPLCMGIPEREREQFIEGFDYSVKSYMKGDVVFRQGDVCRFLYILLEGEVEAEMTDDSGAMLRIETIRGKLIHYILELASPDKKKVLLEKSQQELAEYFGVTRPALAKVLYELADEGMISVNRREIIILDREKMRRVLN